MKYGKLLEHSLRMQTENTVLHRLMTTSISSLAFVLVCLALIGVVACQSGSGLPGSDSLVNLINQIRSFLTSAQESVEGMPLLEVIPGYLLTLLDAIQRLFPGSGSSSPQSN